MKETPLGSGNSEPEGASPGPAPRVSVRSCTLLGRPRSPLGSKAKHRKQHTYSTFIQFKGRPWAAGGGLGCVPEVVVMPPATVEWDLPPQRRSHQARLWGLC